MKNHFSRLWLVLIYSFNYYKEESLKATKNTDWFWRRNIGFILISASLSEYPILSCDVYLLDLVSTFIDAPE